MNSYLAYKPIFYFLAIIFALPFGSFAGVLIYRIPKKESIIKPRSRCISCGYELKFRNLIPIFSYLFQNGKCVKCGKKIGINLLLVEIGMLILFLVSVFISKNYIELFLLLLLSFATLVLGIIDLKHFLLPGVIVWPLNIFLTIFLIINNTNTIKTLSYGLGLSAFIFILWFISKGKGIGFGDVRLAYFVGALSAYYGLLDAYYSFVISLCITVILILTITIFKKSKLKGMKLAFGPTLLLSSWICILLTYFKIDF